MRSTDIRKFLGSGLGQMLIGAVIGACVFLIRYRNGAEFPVHSFHEFLAAASNRGFPPGMLISILWFMVFGFYWEAAAKSASEAKRRESSFSRGFHVTLVSLAQILVLIPVPHLRMRFLPESTAQVIIALAFELSFFCLAIWARLCLGRNWSAVVTAKVGHELVRSGPYRIVRHPIYTGMLGVYLSMAFVSGEIRGLIGTAIALLAYWRKTRIEEEYLGNEFGEEYERYRTTTWALIPGVL